MTTLTETKVTIETLKALNKGLCADLEVAKAELQECYNLITIKNKMIEAMAQEGIDLHQCTGFDSDKLVETYETDEQVIARFREDAEVVLQSHVEAEKRK